MRYLISLHKKLLLTELYLQSSNKNALTERYPITKSLDIIHSIKAIIPLKKDPNDTLCMFKDVFHATHLYLSNIYAEITKSNISINVNYFYGTFLK